MTLADVAQRLNSRRIGAIVVCNPRGEVVGVISERDVLRTGGFAHPDGPEDVLARLGHRAFAR